MRSDIADARPGGLPVTASFGVAVGVGDAVDYPRLYLAADQALYAAPDAGRNAVR